MRELTQDFQAEARARELLAKEGSAYTVGTTSQSVIHLSGVLQLPFRVPVVF